MMEIHGSVLRLFKMMYDPDEMMNVVLYILSFYAEAAKKGLTQYPFMVIPFGDEWIAQTEEYEVIPETYIWN